MYKDNNQTHTTINWKRYALRLCLFFAIMLGVFWKSSATGKAVTVSTEAQLRSALAAGGNNTIYIDSSLTYGIRVSSALRVRATKTIIGNGKSITKADNYTGVLFYVGKNTGEENEQFNGWLKLQNTTVGGRYNNGANNQSLINIQKGRLSVDENSVLTNNTSNNLNGGGIYCHSGTIVYFAGKIDNCTTSTNGGGIYAINATVNLNNALITNCKAEGSGGGIFMHHSNADYSSALHVNVSDNNGPSGGKFTLISNCTANASDNEGGGGGIRIFGSSMDVDGDASNLSNYLLLY